MEKKLLSTLKAEHANLQKQICSLQEQMREKSKELMKAAFASFFEKYSDAVENIFWNQYTPYFNDGESCEFSVYDVFITLKSDAEDEDFDDDSEGSSIYDNYDLERLKKKIAEIEAWKKDPRGEAIKYREDYIKKYNRDPFNDYYNRNKTEEQRIAEWKPFYGSEEDHFEELENAIYFIETYPDLKSNFEDIKNMISGIDENLMKAMFDDHVKVIATVDGIETEEYQHD